MRSDTKARWDQDESPSRFRLLFEHDLFGKPLHTFPDHALGEVAMPGLVPGIHVLHARSRRVDGRYEPGHDAFGSAGTYAA
ncbi:Fumarate hydratase class II (modular protein) [Bradyrhizobium vignae]|uniref:Fumarate hydratase class II (Modular protein) n=1 Tax=Bradyrhizobium vignae TaxID=1549949 RepID=A0A2U3Q7Z8_9BRAD|nr:Fumarate hydratase class II (modular protein) [Bradyrhizobium vignae]